MDSRIKKKYNERNKIEKKEGKEGSKEPKLGLDLILSDFCKDN